MRAFYVIPADGQLAACAGLEVFGRHALLRSMAVQSPLRLKGVGRELCEAVEQRAREEGVQSLYLLTTTAESFFSKRGFERCLRDEVPEAVRNCAEFQSLCPQSAAVMLKRL